MGHALPATDAVACLTQFGHAAVITYQKGSPGFLIIGIQMAFGNIAVVDAFVVMEEDAFVVMEEVRRNIYPVWTGHAILAVGAGDILAVLHSFCHVL